MNFIELYEKYIDSSDYPKINVGNTTELAENTRALYKSCIMHTSKHLSGSVSRESFVSENRTEILKGWLIDLNSSESLNNYSEGHRANILWVFEQYIDFIISGKYLKYS